MLHPKIPKPYQRFSPFWTWLPVCLAQTLNLEPWPATLNLEPCTQPKP